MLLLLGISSCQREEEKSNRNQHLRDAWLLSRGDKEVSCHQSHVAKNCLAENGTLLSPRRNYVKIIGKWLNKIRNRLFRSFCDKKSNWPIQKRPQQWVNCQTNASYDGVERKFCHLTERNFFTFSRDFFLIFTLKTHLILVITSSSCFSFKISLKTSNLFRLNCAKLFFWSSAFFQLDRSKSKNVMSRLEPERSRNWLRNKLFFRFVGWFFSSFLAKWFQWWQSVVWLKLVLVSRFCFLLT